MIDDLDTVEAPISKDMHTLIKRGVEYVGENVHPAAQRRIGVLTRLKRRPAGAPMVNYWT